MSEIKKKLREFKLTSIALKNVNTVLMVTALLAIVGAYTYKSLPKESFPEVNIPWVFVNTIYPGNSPVDIENLITHPIEKELKSITGMKQGGLTSISAQDNSQIKMEFKTGVDISDALQDVKDAVDRAKNELPNDLDLDPMVVDVDPNEFPILNINMSGDYSVSELRKFAEYLEEEVEKISQISKVNIKGIEEREIQINVDLIKMEASQINFTDIENAISFENMTVSAGEIKINNTTRAIRTVGEFISMKEIEDVIVKREKEDIVYLKDIAEVKDTYKDPLTIARLDNNPVVSLQVIKSAGENLLEATANINKVIAEGFKEHALPKGLKISITNDQSDQIRSMVKNLENSILMGMIFVIMVLYFFLGFRNASLVALAIPLSMLISMVVLGYMGATINMMVLFSLILALGMLVDNAIVVTENTYRFLHQGYNVMTAAKLAVGEIAWPIIASTATTLAAFSPLIFWPGIMGEFMKYLPITLIIVLTSSLFVALVIIPVMSKGFVKTEIKKPQTKNTLIVTGALSVLSILFYLASWNIMGSILLMIIILMLMNLLFLHRLSMWFMNDFLEFMENKYLMLLKWSLAGSRPRWFIVGTIFFLVLTIGMYLNSGVKTLLFPENDPKYINVTAIMAQGTDINATDKFMQDLEKVVSTVIDPVREKAIESVLTTVGTGAYGQNVTNVIGDTPNRGLITISFNDFDKRQGVSSKDIMKKLSKRLIGKYPGVSISVEKNREGPPVGYPVNLEVSGKDFEKLLDVSQKVKAFINEAYIQGIEELKLDVDVDRPEMIVKINRDAARRYGISTGQIASTIRTALYGKEVSDFKVREDEYPIMLRLNRKYRNDVTTLMNQYITFRDAGTGRITQVPISSVASFTYEASYNSVNHKDLNRVVTVYSNVIEGFNPNEINQKIAAVMEGFDMPDGYSYKFTGEQEEQKEAATFLMNAMMIAVFVMLIILVTQFNSVAKPVIILASILFSTIGVFGGLATFQMDFVIIMTGIGIISLAGVVVNNAIVLIDYIDYLKQQKKKELGVEEDKNLKLTEIIDCIVNAGKTRLRPVLLTAVTTILGLVPMATGMNLDFEGLFRSLEPNFYFGGDTATFWGPMAWTVIFGLTFATFLTLILVPVMYLVGNKIKLFFVRK